MEDRSAVPQTHRSDCARSGARIGPPWTSHGRHCDRRHNHGPDAPEWQTWPMLAHVPSSAPTSIGAPPSTTPSSPLSASGASWRSATPSATASRRRRRSGSADSRRATGSGRPTSRSRRRTAPPSGLPRGRRRPRARVAARAAAVARVRARLLRGLRARPRRQQHRGGHPLPRLSPVQRRQASPARRQLPSAERRHEVVEHRRAEILLGCRQGAGGEIGRRLGRLRLVQPDPVRRILAPDGNPIPATPGGSWKPTATDEILDDVLLRGPPAHGLPRFCCAAAWAALNSGQTSSAPWTGLPPLSMATIACVDEEAGRCHVVPDCGTVVPTGASAMSPLPSAPNDPVQVHPTVGPSSISVRSRRCRRPGSPAGASAAGTLTETDPGRSAVVVVTPEVVWHTTTGSVAVTIGPEVVVGVLDRRVGVGRVVDVVSRDAVRGRRRRVLRMGRRARRRARPRRPARRQHEPPAPAPHQTDDTTHSPPPRTTPLMPHPRRPIRLHAYASTVRSANRSAKRRCASAVRVGMCSVGTSCGVYPFSTRRATVWRCTSSGPS